MSSIASSTLLAACVLKVGFQLVSNHTALMVSIFTGWMLNLCMRLWRGVECRFTSLFAAFLMGLCSGCGLGSVASHAAIMMAARLCIDASLVTMACLACPSFVLLLTFCCGVRNMSAAYNIRGTAIKRYSCCIYLAFVPHDKCAILPN